LRSGRNPPQAGQERGRVFSAYSIWASKKSKVPGGARPAGVEFEVLSVKSYNFNFAVFVRPPRNFFFKAKKKVPKEMAQSRLPPLLRLSPESPSGNRLRYKTEPVAAA
jgi:hypothetical protein